MEFLEAREFLSFCICSGVLEQEEAKKRFTKKMEKGTETYFALPDGTKHGKCESFCFGEREEVEYRDGKKHGKLIRKAKKGWIIHERNYVDGKCHGQAVYFYRNGRKELESFYEHGKRLGKCTYWDSNGNVISTKNGIAVFHEHCP